MAAMAAMAAMTAPPTTPMTPTARLCNRRAWMQYIARQSDAREERGKFNKLPTTEASARAESAPPEQR